MICQSLIYLPGLRVQGGVDHHHLEVTLLLCDLFLKEILGRNEKSLSIVKRGNVGTKPAFRKEQMTSDH